MEKTLYIKMSRVLSVRQVQYLVQFMRQSYASMVNKYKKSIEKLSKTIPNIEYIIKCCFENITYTKINGCFVIKIDSDTKIYGKSTELWSRQLTEGTLDTIGINIFAETFNVARRQGEVVGFL